MEFIKSAINKIDERLNEIERVILEQQKFNEETRQLVAKKFQNLNLKEVSNFAKAQLKNEKDTDIEFATVFNEMGTLKKHERAEGEKQEEFFYDSGKLSGVIIYDNTGIKRRTSDYHENGNPWFINIYNKAGERKREERFHKSGKLWYIEIYNNEKKQKEIRFHKNGKLWFINTYDNQGNKKQREYVTDKTDVDFLNNYYKFYE